MNEVVLLDDWPKLLHLDKPIVRLLWLVVIVFVIGFPT